VYGSMALKELSLIRHTELSAGRFIFFLSFSFSSFLSFLAQLVKHLTTPIDFDNLSKVTLRNLATCQQCGFFLLYSQLYFGLLSYESTSEWVPSLQTQRKQYSQLKEKLILDPAKLPAQTDLEKNNPLSQDDEVKTESWLNGVFCFTAAKLRSLSLSFVDDVDAVESMEDLL